MRGNGQGEFKTTPFKDMEAHDALPPLLRWAGNYAVNSFASEIIASFWRAGVPEASILDSLRRADARGTLETYGRAHPEARL